MNFLSSCSLPACFVSALHLRPPPALRDGTQTFSLLHADWRAIKEIRRSKGGGGIKIKTPSEHLRVRWKMTAEQRLADGRIKPGIEFIFSQVSRKHTEGCELSREIKGDASAWKRDADIWRVSVRNANILPDEKAPHTRPDWWRWSHYQGLLEVCRQLHFFLSFLAVHGGG